MQRMISICIINNAKQVKYVSIVIVLIVKYVVFVMSSSTRRREPRGRLDRDRDLTLRPIDIIEHTIARIVDELALSMHSAQLLPDPTIATTYADRCYVS